MKGIWRRTLLLGAIASLIVCGTAQAQVTFGAIPAETPLDTCDAGPFDITQQFVGPGVTYEAPTSGVITSWSTHAAAGPNQRLSLKLVNPFSGGFLVLDHDGPRALVPGQVNTFRTLMPVEEGELLALSSTGGPTGCAFFSEEPADSIIFRNGFDTPDGDVWQPEDTTEEFLLNVRATILPPPRIALIAPTSGSVAGGTPVTVRGFNFAEVRSVSFSGVPALSFSVIDETHLTAVSPPNTELTSRTVEVTTAAGRANSPQTFNYVAAPVVARCVVPQLKNQKLKAAKKKLKSAGCALGKVKRLGKASISKGKITRQSPAAGKVLASGGKVSVTLKGGTSRR